MQNLQQQRLNQLLSQLGMGLNAATGQVTNPEAAAMGSTQPRTIGAMSPESAQMYAMNPNAYLESLRGSSPTGGSIGQVSNGEIARMMAQAPTGGGMSASSGLGQLTDQELMLMQDVPSLSNQELLDVQNEITRRLRASEARDAEEAMRRLEMNRGSGLL